MFEYGISCGSLRFFILHVLQATGTVSYRMVWVVYQVPLYGTMFAQYDSGLSDDSEQGNAHFFYVLYRSCSIYLAYAYFS